MVYNIICSKNKTPKFLEQAIIILLLFLLNKFIGDHYHENDKT